jgi:uncharacterized membrane protein
LINYQLIGLHDVNEAVSRDQWVYWDAGFLIWGAIMLIAGWRIFKAGARATFGETA